jgi:hypothetical protein
MRAFRKRACLRRVSKVPDVGLVALGGFGQPATEAICNVCGFRVAGLPCRWSVVPALAGTTDHRPASRGHGPMRKTADLAYIGRDSSARDIYMSPDPPYEPNPPREEPAGAHHEGTRAPQALSLPFINANFRGGFGLEEEFYTLFGGKSLRRTRILPAEACIESALWLTQCSAAADMRKGAPVHDP